MFNDYIIMKKISILLILLISLTIGFSDTLFVKTNNDSDIPSPISPEFIKNVKACGKIDLIDRNNKNYNASALVDGSLDGCDQ